MLPINTIIYGLLAGLLVGLHVFSIKIIQLHFSYNYYTFFLMLGSLFLWIISRFFLFRSFKTTNVSTFAHALLFIGLLVSVILDHLILNKSLKPPIYLGIGCLLLGYGIIIQYGY